jgi:hypothetical protein
MVGTALLLHGGRGIGSWWSAVWEREINWWWWPLAIWVGASYERRGAQRRFPTTGYNG